MNTDKGDRNNIKTINDTIKYIMDLIFISIMEFQEKSWDKNIITTFENCMKIITI